MENFRNGFLDRLNACLMGEINTGSAASKKRGVMRVKKLSTRVDLTPMVDLGFLLITFFIFTTSMSEPRAMRLTLPTDKHAESPTQAAEGKTLNIVIGGEETLWYYPGIDMLSMKKVKANANGIRPVIMRKIQQVARSYGDARETVIVVKPTREASYKDIVLILDEIMINGVSRYFFVDADSSEITAIEKKNK